MNIFPPEVAQKEVAHYKTVMQRYGVPLDSRTKLTKTDWSFWSATLADNQADFETLISPIYDYLNQTTARSPFVDSYVTDDVHSDGMHARPVIGGVFIKMLADRAMWTKWAGADKTKVGPWAPLPVPPKIVEVVPTAQKTAPRCGVTRRANPTTNGPSPISTPPPGRKAREFWHRRHAGRGGADALGHRRHLAASRDHNARPNDYRASIQRRSR